MTMNQISEDIIKLYDQLEGNESQPIDGSIVDEAISVINNRSAIDSNSLFLLLSALNLLNAAVKTEKHKSQLYYGFIKSKVSKIADVIIQDPASFASTSLFYDSVQKCMYFEVFGVIFSFHQIFETKLIKNVASKNTPIQWTGVRLQRIAQRVYELAKANYDNRNVMTENLVIDRSEQMKKLKKCQDCGNEISPTALFCPHCGCIPNESIITNGYHAGDKVQVNYNINKILGEIVSISPIFLKIKRRNNGIITVRQSSIDSIQILEEDTSDNIELSPINTKSPISTVQIVDSFDALLSNIFPILSIGNKTLIPTNATVTEINDSGIIITSDTGQSYVLDGIMVNFRKKTCFKGARLYCHKLSENGSMYSLLETTFHNVMTIFRKALLYRRGITAKRKKTMLAILKFMMDEMTFKKEAYTEIAKFQKNLLSYFGENAEIIDDETQAVSDNEFSKNSSVHANLTIVHPVNLYKTETERLLEGDGLPKLKVLGKINLDALPRKMKKLSASSISDSIIVSEIPKPLILASDEVIEFLSKKLTNLSETKCKQLEKELDTLIRNGEKEECLRRSYQIINESRPTPKYLRSYLDRIVNTEIALNHTTEALQSLAYLIVLTEQQSDVNVNSIGHLYITMARLYQKDNNREEALKAILYAESVKPNNNAITKLKESIQRMDSNGINNSDSSNDTSTPINGSVDTNDSISKMLPEDVCQEAKRQELLPSNEIIPAEQLFGRAQNKRNDDTESFEGKAQLFLEAAGAYYNTKQTSSIMYKISVANYARMKGHGMYARFANLIRNNTGEFAELQALCDCACSYYIEALGIFNSLGEKNHLQELLLKYLQLHFVISQLEGGKTPDSDWEDWTLKAKLQEILFGDSNEEQKVFFRSCIAIGASSENSWNTLSGSPDGLMPMFSAFRDDDNLRKKCCNLINSIENANVDSKLTSGTFLKRIIQHRRTRITKLETCLHDCLEWKFDQFDITTFVSLWDSVLEHSALMTNTDTNSQNIVKEVLNTLANYAGHRENERYRSLVTSQQILLNGQKSITETTTNYGRTFFSHLFNNWLEEIGRQIKEKEAQTLPVLSISCEPAFITKDLSGNGYISIVVTNNGDSTAESFVVTASINGKKYSITHNEELSAGDCCGERFISPDFYEIISANVKFDLVAKYQGKELQPREYEATYEVENEDVLSDEIDIPWTISNTPEEHIFKGREKELRTLIDHYVSKDRSLTYILYGLTRTGKSSILDYLRNRIDGQILKEDSSKHILAFKWYLNEFPYKNSTSAQFWTWALETNIYDKLTDELADKVEAAYGEDGLPPAESLSQIDFCKVVDVLNENNVIPLVTIDEFSFVRLMLKEGLIDATFISTLRNLALAGKACFVYSGTYDIKELPKEKEYIAGQMNNTLPMPINQIEEQYANELIDACPKIIFDERAKVYIRALSGCVPYWIQWICLACGKYAIASKHRHLGFNEVNDVVRVLTGEVQPGKRDTWESLDETNFHNNQIDPENIAEHQLISSISYLNRESTQIERGISMDELKRLWDKYSVNEERRLSMTRALASLKDKKILYSFTDEGREVYRLSVDLFRRWWYVHHRDLDLEFSL